MTDTFRGGASGRTPGAKGEFEWTDDQELLDFASAQLEPGEQGWVQARCIGHPFGSGGGCGWEGKGVMSRAANLHDRGPATVMPSCPSCGGWAEPVATDRAVLREVPDDK